MKYILKKEKISSLRSMKLKDLECKHIVNIDSNITTVIFEQSVAIDYRWVIFGSHRNTDLQEEVERINIMCKLPERPLKIVITSDGTIWCDNTHWTMAYILKYGPNTKLSQVPHYIIDFRSTTTTIISINNSVIEDEKEIIKTIIAAKEIEKRVLKNYRTELMCWTVENLQQQLLNMLYKKDLFAVEHENLHYLNTLFKDRRFHMAKSVLEGVEGIAYSDNIKNPTFAILLLKNYCFIAGGITTEELHFVCNTWRLNQYEIIPTDDIFIKLREIYKQSFICSTRYAFEHKQMFDTQKLLTYISALSTSYLLKTLSAKEVYIIQQNHFMNVTTDYGQNGIGVCCMHNNEIVGVASSNIYYRTGIEVNIKVHENYRRKGIALALASELILLCIRENKEISWDAANIESLHLADKLGFVYHSSYNVCEIITSVEEY